MRCATSALVLVVVASVLFISGVGPARSASADLTVPSLVREGLVFPVGTPGSFDDFQVSNPSILVEGGVYRMWYHGCAYYAGCSIGLATSTDGVSWTRMGRVLAPSLPSEGNQIQYPSVIKVRSQYWMWYNGWDGSTWTLLAATSSDGVSWTKLGVVMNVGPSGSQDAYATLEPHVLLVKGSFRMYYTGFPGPQPTITKIMLATSHDGVSWTRMGVVLGNGSAGSGDSFGAEASSVARVGSAYLMVYRGQTEYSTTSLMEAVSSDGIAWTKLGVVLSPLAPYENVIGWPFILPQPKGSIDVYYVARAGAYDLQIYLASQAALPKGLV